tara:strand:+ start:176 stop:370 length:195 start_codon:yes stop_codon:yes gene_type:complete
LEFILVAYSTYQDMGSISYLDLGIWVVFWNNMSWLEYWLILMVTINTAQNLVVFFVGRKFKKNK